MVYPHITDHFIANVRVLSDIRVPILRSASVTTLDAAMTWIMAWIMGRMLTPSMLVLESMGEGTHQRNLEYIGSKLCVYQG